MADFIPGLELSRLFYLEAVKPILDADFPDLRYAAALSGSGSEILGFDTEMSADHGWGPRLLLFLAEDDLAEYREAIDDRMRRRLPPEFRGYSTSYALYENDNGSLVAAEASAGAIDHRVEILTVRGFFLDYLNFDVRLPIELADWLTFPEQKLRTINEGAIYHDEIGLGAAFDRFRYYPGDVWLYLLAAGWNRIGQEEHLMGRAGMIGDEIGSAIIASRLVRDLMRLCFLMEKQFAPYPKWFGKAFSRLECAAELTPVFKKALSAENWTERERFLAEAYETVARMHNRLGITGPLQTRAERFFNRPFLVIHLHGDFAGAIASRIADPEVRRLAEKKLIGSIDQFSDSTDILSDPQWRFVLRKLYE